MRVKSPEQRWSAANVAVTSHLEQKPVEWPLVQSDRSIPPINLWLLRLSWLHSRHHLIEQLTN
jgi:hypothetical protein